MRIFLINFALKTRFPKENIQKLTIMTHEELMRKACELSAENVAQGGGPFGAVIARDGVVVAEALTRGVPVIVTDGAPAWSGLLPGQGRYVAGYVAGSEETRVTLLKAALKAFVCGDWGER